MTHLKKYWWIYLLIILAILAIIQYQRKGWPFGQKVASSNGNQEGRCPAGSHWVPMEIRCITTPCPQGMCVPDAAGSPESNTGNVNPNNQNTSYV